MLSNFFGRDLHFLFISNSFSLSERKSERGISWQTEKIEDQAVKRKIAEKEYSRGQRKLNTKLLGIYRDLNS
jgi:hypothetical protein